MLGSKTEQRGEAEHRRNRDPPFQEVHAGGVPPADERAIFR
jgi:hypothetical protein